MSAASAIEAAMLEPHLSGPRGTSDEDYAAEQTALDLADRILAIPEIAEALRLVVISDHPLQDRDSAR